MNIIKLRRGHATNSSSSHSIILASSWDKQYEDMEDTESPRNNTYGWGLFCLKDYQSKIEYFATHLATLKDPEKAKVVFGFDVGDGYVDHQSMDMGIPYTWDGSELNLDFFKEFAECIARDDSIYIRGGNDNSDSDEYGEPVNILKLMTKKVNVYSIPDIRDFCNLYEGKVIARKTNGVWLLYRPRDGLKIHLDLTKSIDEASFRPEYPELVDLKITDYCDIGCKFCYQDSTKQGSSAPTRRILEWMDTCKDQGVIEVAMGGGETTSHPDFAYILEEACKRFINVSFTTKDESWLDNPEIVNIVKSREQIRSIGWSIDTAYKRDHLRRRWNEIFKKGKDKLWYEDKYHCKLVFHLIPDAIKETEFQKIIVNGERNDVYLLLGLKDVGRGEDFKSTGAAKFFFEYCKNKLKQDSHFDLMGTWDSPGSFSIDTAFARQYKSELERIGISEKLYYLEEGRFSLYYDAVTNWYGPSSYEPNLMAPAWFRDPKIPIGVKQMFNSLPRSIDV